MTKRTRTPKPKTHGTIGTSDPEVREMHAWQHARCVRLLRDHFAEMSEIGHRLLRHAAHAFYVESR